MLKEVLKGKWSTYLKSIKVIIYLVKYFNITLYLT
jgi:hypothetical protein